MANLCWLVYTHSTGSPSSLLPKGCQVTQWRCSPETDPESTFCPDSHISTAVSEVGDISPWSGKQNSALQLLRCWAMPSWNLCDLHCATHPVWVFQEECWKLWGQLAKERLGETGQKPQAGWQGSRGWWPEDTWQPRGSNLPCCWSSGAAWGTTQRAASLSWGHKLFVTAHREDIPPHEITSQSLLPALCVPGVWIRALLWSTNLCLVGTDEEMQVQSKEETNPIWFF